MDSAEIKQHLDTIVGNIASIRSLTRQINFDDFRQSDRMRQNIYGYLQKIGKAAEELYNAKPRLDRDFALDTLATFKNAKHNREAEIQHQNVWNLIELDLPVIGKEIEQSPIYTGRDLSMKEKSKQPAESKVEADSGRT